MPRPRKPSVRRQGNPSSGFFLERRSPSGTGKTGTVSKSGKVGKTGSEQLIDNDVRPLSVDAFIEVLNRYCRRFLRDGRNFSLASLRILEYERVKETAGVELADQLDQLGETIICSALRGEDRICFVGPAQYLVLMPGTIYDDAHKAMERAALAIAERSLRQKSQIVRPSATFLVTSCTNAGSISGGDADTLVATETLLEDVGYALGAHNALVDLSLGASIVSGGKCSMFAGCYDTWFDRYKSVGGRLTDTWSTVDHEMVLSVWQPAPDTVSGVNREALLRRLRALQSIEHPAFNRVTDFFITPDWKVSLISSKLDGVDLKGGPANKRTRKVIADSLQHASDLTILSWMTQICNSLIAAQAMSPPLVLSDFSKIRVTLLPNDRIVLSDFEAEYLQIAFEEPKMQARKDVLVQDGGGKKSNDFIGELARFGLELVELMDEARAGSRKQSTKTRSDTTKTCSDAPISEFRDLLLSLSTHQENGEKCSLYKLRTALRAIQEA